MMSALPDAVVQHLNRLTLHDLKPAWIRLNGEFPEDWGGDWACYGGLSLQKDMPVDQSFPFLFGLLTKQQDDLHLSFIEMEDGNFADIHMFQTNEAHWILFLDATEKAAQYQQMQQIANELSLLRGKQTSMLNQYLGAPVVEKLAEGLLGMNIDGERRDISTMFADLRNFTVFNESHEPTVVMSVLNEYLDAMIQPVLHEAGIVDKITGDGVMAVFGVMPSEIASAVHAVKAGKEMQKAVSKLNLERSSRGVPLLDIGIGIASGTAVLGILGSKERRSFSAIGRHVNLAARLEGQAKACEIVLDEPTFYGMDGPEEQFEKCELSLKGIAGKVTAYRGFPD